MRMRFYQINGDRERNQVSRDLKRMVSEEMGESHCSPGEAQHKHENQHGIWKGNSIIGKF